MNDNLIPKKSYSNIDLQTEEAFRSREGSEKISVKPERLLKLKALEKTKKNMDLVSKRLSQYEKNVNAMEVKETSKSSERIFCDLICQLLGEISDDEIKDLVKIEVQQILVKAKLAKFRECKMHPILTYSMSHQHIFWFQLVNPIHHIINPIHHQFNLQRLTRR